MVELLLYTYTNSFPCTRNIWKWTSTWSRTKQHYPPKPPGILRAEMNDLTPVKQIWFVECNLHSTSDQAIRHGLKIPTRKYLTIWRRRRPTLFLLSANLHINFIYLWIKRGMQFLCGQSWQHTRAALPFSIVELFRHFH